MIRLTICWLLAVVLSGCSQESLLQKFSSPEDQAVARRYIDLLRQKRFEEIEKAADPSIRGPSLQSTLSKMAALVPPGEPNSVKLVGAQKMSMNGVATVNTTFEYEIRRQWLLINVAVKKQDGAVTIVGFNVVPQHASLEEQNKFTLSGRSLGQYLLLAAIVVVPLLTLYALIACVKTKTRGRKWPWILFILLGVGKVAVNWSTGQWAFAALSVQLFGAAATAPLYGPWTLAASFPLGAIAFLFLRSRLAETTAQS